ncbi:hypothetical protein LTR16_004711, partial [Cryomyces antarcticus]
MAKILLDFGANIEQTDSRGLTPLLIAAKHKQPELVRLLLRNASDVHARDSNKRNVLHHATSGAREEDVVHMVLSIVEYEPDVNAKDNEGKTPLHYCVKFHNTQAAMVLIQKGAVLEAKDDAGETAAALAIKMKKYEFVKLLYNAGAELDRTAVPLKFKRFNNFLDKLEAKGRHPLTSHAMSVSILKGYNSKPRDPGTQEEATQGDARSVANTDGRSLNFPSNSVALLISAFAAKLCEHLDGVSRHRDAVKNIVEALPDLLKFFSLKLEPEAKPGPSKAAMTFVRRHRSDIAEAVKEVMSQAEHKDSDADSVNERPRPTDIHDFKKIVGDWKNQNDEGWDDPNMATGEPADVKGFQHTFLDEEDLGAIPDVSTAREFLIESSAYRWLLDNLKARSLGLLTERK